ncbi:MAG TPA: hypothetical protein VHP31_11370 [Caproicibacter sp.]|nr:hypothetical protein [Caproicibacter sp.]
MDYLVMLEVELKDNQKLRLGSGHHILWDIRDLIFASSGLTILNQQDYGLARALIPLLQKGILELSQDSSSYSHYDVLYGLGTVSDALVFYRNLLSDCIAHPYAELYGCISA